jgi:hypothetical protein
VRESRRNKGILAKIMPKSARMSERESNKVLVMPFEPKRNTISITIVFHEMLIGSIIEADAASLVVA